MEPDLLDQGLTNQCQRTILQQQKARTLGVLDLVLQRLRFRGHEDHLLKFGGGKSAMVFPLANLFVFLIISVNLAGNIKDAKKQG